MDLVAGVRKEGSRGGRDAFKWSDVKESSHRENYLGHSLMAPVGRWQQGRDLSWYAKRGDEGDAERNAELQKIKEAEQEAMSRALGLPVLPKTSTGANSIPVAGNEVQKLVKGTAEAVEDDDIQAAQGIGFGRYDGSKRTDRESNVERLEATGYFDEVRKESRHARKDESLLYPEERRARPRPRNRDDKDSNRRYEHAKDRHDRRSHRSRSPNHRHERERERERHRSRDRDGGRPRERDRHRRGEHRRSRHDRSRSPEKRRDEHYRSDSRDHRRHR